MHGIRLRRVTRLCSVMILALLLSATSIGQGPSNTVSIDAKAATTAFPHFWEKMFGSGRAILTLRDSYRRDLRNVKSITGFDYVRFHAIFHDEVGVYDEDAQGNVVYNFSYIDQIYDGLLENHVRPFIELSFTPRKLAPPNPILHAFWYKQITSPPKDWAKWEEFIFQFTTHLKERYGEEEVSKWYFEVWNEPNIDFWAGEPKQPTYFELYDRAARAVKRVSPNFRVGGPATAQAAWADTFINHCVQNNVPVDFVSSHVYGNDLSTDVFGTTEDIPRNQMVCRAIDKVHKQIKASAKPTLPLIWSEFNASYKNEVDVTDSTYMGPWLADTIRQCDGKVDILAYWTFSDVFEEQGVVKNPFYGGFGLIAAGGIEKPAFNAFRLLHLLGDTRLPVDSDSVVATRRSDGTLVLAVWNLVPPGQSGPDRTLSLKFQNVSRSAKVSIQRVDASHGDTLNAYIKMGNPKYPTRQQVDQLNSVANPAKPEKTRLKDGGLSITIPAHGLALIEIK